MKRRNLVLGLAANLPFGAASALASQKAASLALLAAGPDGSQTSRWASACALALSPGFSGAPDIIAAPQGGLDGVTGANRLDALVVPDGKTAALLPGAALTAWLAGDSRVQFDPTRWTPILAGCNSGVLVVRGATPPSLAALTRFGTLRLAAATPQSSDLAALLALARMGLQIAPVFGLHDITAKTRAFVAGEVDAVFLCCENVPAYIAPLAANGGVPVFSLGQISGGVLGPDPLFPQLPEAGSFAPASSALGLAYQAAAAAARLDFFMVLPHLTDPQAIASWRQAAEAGLAQPALQSAASASAVQLLGADDTARNLGALRIAPGEQTAMQNFLSQRFGWRAA